MDLFDYTRIDGYPPTVYRSTTDSSQWDSMLSSLGIIQFGQECPQCTNVEQCTKGQPSVENGGCLPSLTGFVVRTTRIDQFLTVVYRFTVGPRTSAAYARFPIR